MDNLARREIIPDLKGKGLRRHGWHTFRRGLATNLPELGIRDDVIQRILRHADVGTASSIMPRLCGRLRLEKPCPRLIVA